ncbi:hypothetical protein [Micromonospora sp. NPDC092111]|uniref:hypothetical protein n=1 Tax=Micromonospora sp. NPDC092111 TaxID=3364289 RepID=UPI0037FE445C
MFAVVSAATSAFAAAAGQPATELDGYWDATVSSRPSASADASFQGVRRSDPAEHPLAAAGPGRPGSAPNPDNPSHSISLRAVDRAGNPADDGQTSYAIYSLETGGQVAFGQIGADSAVQLPAGRFGMRSSVLTPGSDTAPASRTLVIHPELDLTADTTVTLDARAGKPVSVDLDQPTATQVSALVTVLQTATNGRLIRYEFGDTSFTDGTYFVTPTPARSDLNTYVYTVWTMPDRPEIYNLVNATTGRVPEQLIYRVRVATLAAVQVRYPAQGVDACGGTYIGPLYQGVPATVSYGTRFPLPTRRTEYYIPSTDVSWFTEFDQMAKDCTFDEIDVQTAPPVTYRRPGKHQAIWNSAPFAPSTTDASGQPAATRDGDSIRIRLPMFADSQPGHGDYAGPYAGATGAVVLSSGDAKVCGSDLEAATCDAPSGLHEYQLAASATRKVSWSTLSTQTATNWTFRSATTPSTQALPLISAKYDMRLDDYNNAPANQPYSFAVVTGTRMTTATLDVSIDGGVTWRPVPLDRTHNGWQATLVNPASGGVSLRFAATDAAGNHVRQTITNAYQVS